MRERVEMYSGGKRVGNWLIEEGKEAEFVDDPSGRFTGYVKFKSRGRTIVVCGAVVITQEGRKKC